MNKCLATTAILGCAALFGVCPSANAQGSEITHTVNRLNGLTLHRFIRSDGSVDPERHYPSASFRVTLEAGKVYTMEMRSTSFDSYLRVVNPHGQKVAEDDDSAGNQNARIVFRPPATGDYQLFCTTFKGGTGPFTLTVREQGQAAATSAPAAFVVPPVQVVPYVNLPELRKIRPN